VSRDEFGRLGHHQNISKIQKKSISETRENKIFGKKRLTQGLMRYSHKFRKTVNVKNQFDSCNYSKACQLQINSFDVRNLDFSKIYDKFTKPRQFRKMLQVFLRLIFLAVLDFFHKVKPLIQNS